MCSDDWRGVFDVIFWLFGYHPTPTSRGPWFDEFFRRLSVWRKRTDARVRFHGIFRETWREGAVGDDVNHFHGWWTSFHCWGSSVWDVKDFPWFGHAGECWCFGVMFRRRHFDVIFVGLSFFLCGHDGVPVPQRIILFKTPCLGGIRVIFSHVLSRQEVTGNWSVYSHNWVNTQTTE